MTNLIREGTTRATRQDTGNQGTLAATQEVGEELTDGRRLDGAV